MITITENNTQINTMISFGEPPEYDYNTSTPEEPSSFYNFGTRRMVSFSGIKEEEIGFYTKELLDLCEKYCK